MHIPLRYAFEDTSFVPFLWILIHIFPCFHLFYLIAPLVYTLYPNYTVSLILFFIIID